MKNSFFIVLIVLFCVSGCSEAGGVDSDNTYTMDHAFAELRGLQNDTEISMRQQNIPNTFLSLSLYKMKLAEILQQEIGVESLEEVLRRAESGGVSRLGAHDTLPMELAYIEYMDGFIAYARGEYQTALVHFRRSLRFYATDIARTAVQLTARKLVHQSYVQ